MTARQGAFAALASVVLLAGCTVDQPLRTLPPVPVHTIAPAPVVTPAPALTADEQYLAGMRSVYDFTGIPDSQLLDIGRQTCDTLDTGLSLMEIAVVMASTDGIDPALVGSVFAGAITFLCPEYTDQLDAFTSPA